MRRQREIVAELERDGHHRSAALARELLDTFEKIQAMHVAARYRLLDELWHADERQDIDGAIKTRKAELFQEP